MIEFHNKMWVGHLLRCQSYLAISHILLPCQKHHITYKLTSNTILKKIHVYCRIFDIINRMQKIVLGQARVKVTIV